jgi:lysophospholipid acyltransferase (LPLAT)-like uncharacterized protein
VETVRAILRNETVRRVLCWIAAQYIRLAHLSAAWSVVNGETPRRFWDQDRPFILCFWHGRLLMMPYCWDYRRDIHLLISQHRDGQLLARTVGHFGLKTVTGSSTRGGSAALRGLLRVLKSGDSVGITPDGPRGPRMRASDGIVNMARLAGVPIIPAAYAVRRRRVLSSWDRFLLAWPLNRGVFVWGDPIHVPRGADARNLEMARQRVEDSLNTVSAEADGRCGHQPIEPAPMAGEAAS